MQTFLPYADYAASAKVLDRMRLGKQRVETLQILQTLVRERLITTKKIDTGKVRRISLSPEGTREENIIWDETPIIKKVNLPRSEWTRETLATKGWANHPAVLMWKGHELELLKYQKAICNEWTSRGYADSCYEKSALLLDETNAPLGESAPAWLGWKELHESHKSNLLRKDLAHYRAFWLTLSDNIPYVWPNKDWPPELTGSRFSWDSTELS